MDDNTCSVSRRNFLLTVAAATITPPLLLRSTASAAALEGKLRHACIGVGGMGAYDLKNFREHPQVEIVAICDVGNPPGMC